MRTAARFLLVSICLAFASAWQCQAQTTVAQEKANNTSASSSYAGWTDARTQVQVLTNPYNIAPRNISNTLNSASGSVRNLMYSGFNGKIFVETQEWFCSTQSATYGPIDQQSFPAMPQPSDDWL